MKKSLLLLSLLTSFTVHAESQISKVEFTPTFAPETDAERTNFYTQSSAVVTYRNGTKRTFPLSYQALYHSGDKFGTEQAGLILNKNAKPITRSAPNAEGEVAQGPFISYAPDANSLMGARNGSSSAYLMTHYEYNTEAPNVDASKPAVQLYGQLPAAIYQAKVVQDKKTGRLRVVDLNNVDAAAVDGIWTPCAASLTPWGTHLGGEEYEPNAKELQSTPFHVMNLYTNTLDQKVDVGGSNPYSYGFKFELATSPKGEAKIIKRYAMGRLSNELGDVMPDKRTVYMGDDGRDTVMFMFIADEAGHLNVGSLYAAIWMSTSSTNGGKAELRWIPLGHANEEEIHKLILSGIRFSDIFEVATPAEIKDNPEKFSAFKPVYVYAGTGKEIAHLEYLKLKPGQEKAAAFLESRRYAAYLGATSEFTKMEGVSHNARDKRLYLAMSYIEKGMVDKQSEDRIRDDINLEGDPKDMACGAVYEASMTERALDIDGHLINSEWVASNIHVLISGGKKPFSQAYGEFDKCDTDRIANPDNLKFSESMRTLFIGEDSGNHLNNFLWAYNVDQKQAKPVRIFSAPLGGENTGLQVVEDWNGFAYLMSNIQHAAAADDLKSYSTAVKDKLGMQADKRGVIGYIGGLPSMK